MEEKESDIPQTYLSLLDTPFDSFSPEEQELYENKVKPAFHSFSAILLEVFDQLGRPEEGWEESTKLMPDCPAKVVAMLALYEYRQNAGASEEPLNTLDEYVPPQPDQPARSSPMERVVNSPPPPGARTKTPVKKPAQGQEQEKTGKWWEKKLF